MNYRIRVVDNEADEYWKWCITTLTTGTWKALIGFMGTSSTYCFLNEEDFVAFKLRFDV